MHPATTQDTHTNTHTLTVLNRTSYKWKEETHHLLVVRVGGRGQGETQVTGQSCVCVCVRVCVCVCVGVCVCEPTVLTSIVLENECQSLTLFAHLVGVPIFGSQ